MLYKSKILTLVTMGYSCCIMMSIVIGPKWLFYSCCNYIGLLGTGFMQVMQLSRAPRTKETLPDCLKWHRVTQHPLVFRGLTGSQRTSGFGASQNSTKSMSKRSPHRVEQLYFFLHREPTVRSAEILERRHTFSL